MKLECWVRDWTCACCDLPVLYFPSKRVSICGCGVFKGRVAESVLKANGQLIVLTLKEKQE